MKVEKRISFSENDAGHLYELALEHFCLTEGCVECEHIRVRLEKFIGAKEVTRIKKVLKNNGYCNNKHY